MRTVTHREMRNSSGEILRAVAAGETVRVTNNGIVAALIVPPPRDAVDDLVDRGAARPALASMAGIGAIPRSRTAITTEQVIDDLRNPW